MSRPIRSSNVGNRRRNRSVVTNMSVVPVSRTRFVSARAPMEPRAMGSMMTNGDIDPVPVNSSIKLRHRIQLAIATSTTSGTVVNVTTASIVANLPGSSGFVAFRIIKIDAWGNDADSLTIRMEAPGNDLASFTDWGTPGARRSALHISPSFDVRTAWQVLSGSANQFGVSSTGTSVGVIINLTLELQSSTIAIPMVQ